jgi:maltooligosyltrehalose trehalohydrolase
MNQANLGATYLGDGRCRFLVWAPLARSVTVHAVKPVDRIFPLEQVERGYHTDIIEGIEPGSRYFYRLEEKIECPDPASRFQPEGVHGPSQVVDSRFVRTDATWSGISLQDYIIYELHVGTFTAEGTFQAIIPYLDWLKRLGITAVEMMPVAQFSGNRNWGYDGVFPFAVQDSYGGPDGLKRLVDACHRKGLAVVLDVVYNHLGPEGNCLAHYGPYFTDRYHTPWGKALNFDGAHSDEVRRYFIDNALYWFSEYHMDALRLDALHAILDMSALPFIEELAASVHELAKELNRQIYVIGESAANDARLIREPERGGYGLDAQWNDDFHHALHTLLTGERTGYYQDFGCLENLAKAYREGFVYSGEYSPYRQRRHGVSSLDIPASRFVVFAQNHDQIGNRREGDRLSQLVSFQKLKLAAAAYLLSPFIPLLFMGEEYGETAPFSYFVSHSAPELVEAVRMGRREEFAAFGWQGEIPDPQDEATFNSARLNHALASDGHHRVLRDFYRELIRLRKEIPALANLSKEDAEITTYEKKLLFVRRWKNDSEAIIFLNFGTSQISFDFPCPPGQWRKQVDSDEPQWLGSGSLILERFESGGAVNLTLNPEAFVLFIKEK